MRTSPARISPFPGEGTYFGGSVCNSIARYIRPLNPQLVQGEPLLVELLLYGIPDVGTEQDEFSARLQIGADLRVYITPPGGRAFEYRPARVNPLSPGTVVPLADGEFASSFLTLAHDPQSISGALFEEVGTYRVRMTLECNNSLTPEMDTGIDLGTILVEVQAPANDADRTLGGIVGYDYHEFFRTFQVMRPQSDRDLGILHRLLEVAPTSRHAPFALFSLANHSFDRAFQEPPPGADEIVIDHEQAQRARALFRRFRAEFPDHPLAGNAQILLFRSAMFLQETEEAFALFREAWVDPRMTVMLVSRGGEFNWMFGPQEDAAPPVRGEWALFLDPADGMDPSIYDGPVEARPMTQEEMIQAAMMEAIREGRYEVQYMDGPPPGQ